MPRCWLPLAPDLEERSGATKVFGKGTKTITGASTLTITVTPSTAAVRVLRRARKRGHGLSVKAVLTFTPASGGAVTLEQPIAGRLA